MASKKDLSERDICTKYITPAIASAGWDLNSQVREEVYFTKGRVKVKGKTVERGEAKKADYILYYKANLPIAIVEAKDNNHTVRDGIQQAIDYGEITDIPFVYSSNGDAFVEHDRTAGKETTIKLTGFPSPEELYTRYKQYHGITDDQETAVTQPYYADASGKSPRYYQEIAINRTVRAVTKGADRLLLVMATGTGKTYVAGQIIWKLWKAGVKKRILFLADRNVLIDQTMTNDFKHFGKAMTKIQKRNIDKSYEIYLALYQGLTSNEEDKNAYKEFSPDFFDLVIIDECHRGSAADDSAWREVLNYFKSATHIGLTATPKETTKVSNMEYFGDPIYTYSLKQGIEDGFLAPYKVIQVMLDKDIGGYRPEIGETDTQGRPIEDKIYTSKDFDRTLVLENRTKAVAKEITNFLKKTDRLSKTIVFCVDIEHASRMREALANENPDLMQENRKYVMQITGDNREGKAELDNFIDPESRFPTIVTTSKLMTTGVDAQTCKVIVLDSNISSMTEFKQIIGRGTRLRPDLDKNYFTIIDFRRVTELFADPDFDGEPVKVIQLREGEELTAEMIEGAMNDDIDESLVEERITEKPTIIDAGEIEDGHREKIYVDDVAVEVAYKRTQYLDSDGKLITESLKDYTKKKILEHYASLDAFLNEWSDAKRKYFIIEELDKQGLYLKELQAEVGQEVDPFDLILHVAFDKKKLMTRKERANRVRKSNYFAKYGEKACKVLEGLLDKYADEGLEHVEDLDVLSVQPFRSLGSPVEIVRDFFGGRDGYMTAVSELESALYAPTH